MDSHTGHLNIGHIISIPDSARFLHSQCLSVFVSIGHPLTNVLHTSTKLIIQVVNLRQLQPRNTFIPVITNSSHPNEELFQVHLAEFRQHVARRGGAGPLFGAATITTKEFLQASYALLASWGLSTQYIEALREQDANPFVKNTVLEHLILTVSMMERDATRDAAFSKLRNLELSRKELDNYQRNLKDLERVQESKSVEMGSLAYRERLKPRNEVKELTKSIDPLRKTIADTEDKVSRLQKEYDFWTETLQAMSKVVEAKDMHYMAGLKGYQADQ